MNRRRDLFTLASAERPTSRRTAGGSAVIEVEAQPWALGAVARFEADAADLPWVAGELMPSDEPRGARRLPRRGASSAPPGSGFRCDACGNFVTTQARFSGVQNRNHCPYCLWSKHLDLHAAGDRLAACKEKMRPLGLTLKQSRNKYGDAAGELMLAHVCQGCGKVSINRIAADDDAERLLKVFEGSFNLGESFVGPLARSGVTLAGRSEAAQVKRRLFGAA